MLYAGMAENENTGEEPLKNARHEAFCQNIAKGSVQHKAYADAGYSGVGNSARNGASKLMAKPNIRQRVSYLQAAAACDGVISREQALLRLTDLAQQDARAIQAIQEIAKMLGWYPDPKLDITADVNTVYKLTF